MSPTLAAGAGAAMPGAALILPLIALSVLSLLYYSGLARSVLKTPPSPAETGLWGRGDIIFACGLAGFYLFSILFGDHGKQELSMEAILAGMVLYLLLVGSIVVFMVVRGKNPVAMFGLLRVRWRTGAFCLLSLLAAYPVIYLSQIVSYRTLGAGEAPQEIIQFFQGHPDFGDRLAVILLAVVVAPITEEVIFRGYFYGVLRQYGGRIRAVLVTSLLFAAIHLHAPSMAGLFFLAVALTLIYEKTTSLWAPILSHAAFNAVGICLALYGPDTPL